MKDVITFQNTIILAPSECITDLQINTEATFEVSNFAKVSSFDEHEILDFTQSYEEPLINFILSNNLYNVL